MSFKIVFQIFIVTVIFFFNFDNIKADNFDRAAGLNANYGIAYDLKKHETGQSLDFNLTFLFVSSSCGIRYWSETSSTELYGSLGFGFLNLATIQIGYSSDTYLIYRIVSNPIIPSLVYPDHKDKWGVFRKGISVNLFFEGTFEHNPEMKAGLSIGIIY